MSTKSKNIFTSIYLGVKTGEVIGLGGSNGSGKSSLMRVTWGYFES